MNSPRLASLTTNITMITPNRNREADENQEREAQPPTKPNPNRVFSCKTCGKEFSTFQALGGHRASHTNANADVAVDPRRIKVHECSNCGKKFLSGQALGGHMTKHRKEASSDVSVCTDDMLFKREKIERSKGMELEKSKRAEMLLWGMDLKLGLPVGD